MKPKEKKSEEVMHVAILLFREIYSMIHWLSRTQDVVMPQLHCVVDLRLPEPGLLVP